MGRVRVLLDNCVPRKLAVHLVPHEVTTVARLGWNSLDDGALLDTAEGKYEVFVTMDKSIPFQQRLDHRTLAIILLRATSNRIEPLLSLLPEIQSALKDIQPGQFREIGGSTSS
jgi:hypothetical protein